MTQTPPTFAQGRVLSFVRDFVSEHGCSPSIRTIGAGLGIKSTNGVICHLRALERKGLLRRGPGRHCSLSVAKRDEISTTANTQHDIPKDMVDAIVRAGGECMVDFVVAVARLCSEGPAGRLTVEQRNLLVRSILAGAAGALKPCASMLNLEDGALDHLAAGLREVLA